MATTFRYAGIEIAGDLRQIASEASAKAREAHERDDYFSQAYLVLSVALASLMDNDPSGALEIIEEQKHRLGAGFTMFHLWVMDRTADAWLYQRQGTVAWRYLESQWQAFARTTLARSPLLLTNAHFLRGRCAIAAAAETHEPHYLRHAALAARCLHRMGRPDADVYGALLQAGASNLVGRPDRAIASLMRAQEVSRQHGYRNHRLYAEHNLGLAQGGDDGVTLVRAACATLQASGVIAPAAWVNAYAPGFAGAQGSPAFCWHCAVVVQ